MQKNEISITIVIQAGLSFILSFILILDVFIHCQVKHCQLEMGLLFTNMLQSIITILLFVQMINTVCLPELFLVQCLTLSSFLWTILILQKGCLLTRYPTLVALEYLKTNQFILQVVIAYGLPIIATSLIFINFTTCSIEALTQTSTRLFWTIQSVLSFIFIGIATYHIIKIHLFSRLIKLYSYILYCPIILVLTFPWAIITSFDIDWDNMQDEQYVIQALFFLKNSQIILSTMLFGFNSGCQIVFVENACPALRNKYLQKYQKGNRQCFADNPSKFSSQSTVNIEIGCTTLQTQLLIK